MRIKHDFRIGDAVSVKVRYGYVQSIIEKINHKTCWVRLPDNNLINKKWKAIKEYTDNIIQEIKANELKITWLDRLVKWQKINSKKF